MVRWFPETDMKQFFETVFPMKIKLFGDFSEILLNYICKYQIQQVALA
jgi:hypothetical protein